MPADVDVDTPVELTGRRQAVRADSAWNWLTAAYPLEGVAMAFILDSLPRWERERVSDQLGPTMTALKDLRPAKATDGDD